MKIYYISMGSNKTHPTGRNVKRSRPSDLTDSDSDVDFNLDDSWPRYLVIEPTDENRALSRLSPFAIAKGLQGLAGVPKDVRRLRDGQLLVEVDKKSYSDNLLKSTQLAECPIKVSAHKSLNMSKGVMRCPDLRDCSLEEILEELQSQKVSDVKRIHVTRDNEKRATNTFILTFKLAKLPKEVRIGYLNVPLEVYVPNPLRCFKCQRFGHHKERCKHNAVCAKCGEADHEEANCNQARKCVNCGGKHAAFSKDCPKWKEEKEIQRVKHTLGISYPDARKRVVPVQQSYAAVAMQPKKVVTASVCVQTEYTWPCTSTAPKLFQPANNSGKQSTAACQTTNQDAVKVAAKQPLKPTPRPRSASNDSRNVQGQSAGPISTHNHFTGLDVDDEDEDIMDTSTVSKQKPCPLSAKVKQKSHRGGRAGTSSR